MPRPTPETVYQLDFPSDAVSFDADAFDDLIRTQGVEMVHYRAMPCPVGLIDADDNRHPNDHHENCSNGFVYTYAGTVICGFMSNSKELKNIEIGRADGSTVQVVFPRFYEKERSGTPDVPVQPSPFDRVYLKDDGICVPTWERFQVTDSGVDKLRFPVACVVDLMDSNGRRYQAGTDFNISAGRLVWDLSSNPGIDPVTKKGRVCSIRYTYRPFWYIQRMIHEVRVAQVEDEFTGDRRTHRFPQSMVLQREMFFENEQADKDAKKSIRTAKAANDRDYVPSPDDLGTR